MRPRHLASWLLLAGAAGAVNATAFLACQRFVTHVTGTITQIGLDIGLWTLMAEYAVVLLCFVAGAATSVLMVRSSHRAAGFGAPLALTVCLLVLVTMLGELGLFGPFGGEVESGGSFLLLSLLGFAMGLQNAGVASATALTLRTTHMTGPASDLGVHLATAVVAAGSARTAALKLAIIRGGKLLLFIAGAALAVPLARSVGYYAFLAPAVMVAVATLRSLTHNKGAQVAIPSDLGDARARSAA